MPGKTPAGMRIRMFGREADRAERRREEAERNLRRAWRGIINSPLVKGNPNLAPQERELIERAGDAVARTMGNAGPAKDGLGMMARVGDAARICGIGVDKLGPDHSRLVKAAVAMRNREDEEAMRIMENGGGFTRTERDVAAVLAAVALWPPLACYTGYGRSEYIHDMRNVVEAFAPALWKDEEVRGRMLKYANERMRQVGALGGI